MEEISEEFRCLHFAPGDPGGLPFEGQHRGQRLPATAPAADLGAALLRGEHEGRGEGRKVCLVIFFKRYF